MTDHGRFEELAALAAGGHLSAGEQDQLRQHLAACPECRESARAYRDLVIAGLPLTQGAASDGREEAISGPPAGARDRFLARAASVGVQFSQEVGERTAPARWSVGYRAAAALAVAAALVLAVLSIPQISRQLSSGSDVAELERLRLENRQLNERLTARDQELAGQQAQLQKLRTELDGAVKTASDLRRDGQLPGLRLGRSTSHEARLLEELQNREKQLAAASEEIARINQLRVTDRAALDAQGIKLRDVFNQLRVATATVEMERQLAAAGKDIMQLMLAKQLRVVDVRDTDENGRPGAAFARVFIAEGQAVRIFAFDLNIGANGAARRFQVWGEQVGDPQSVRSLGVLDVDDRTQNRWGLSIQNPAVVKGINSVFVTSTTGAAAPGGPRLLYAFLGQTVAP